MASTVNVTRTTSESPAAVRSTASTKAVTHFAGKAYLSGHIHAGRYKNKTLNTAFLYRTADHGSDALLGASFIVEIRPDETWQIDFRNIGQLRRGICPTHQALGVRFVPEYWRKDRQFCYDEFYSTVVRSALYGLGRHLRKRSSSQRRHMGDSAAVRIETARIFQKAGLDEELVEG